MIDLTTHEPLSGHTSPETAYVVDDYPYGFRLRCKIRYWIESKPRHGDRLVSQTTNPKIADREVWNKPKASTYSGIGVMLRERETGHITWTGLNLYPNAERLAAFTALTAGHLTDDQAKMLRVITKLHAAQAAKRAAAEATS